MGLRLDSHAKYSILIVTDYVLRTVRAKGAEGGRVRIHPLSGGLLGGTAIPNSASSPIWDARTCLRRILRVSLSCWAEARRLIPVWPVLPRPLKRLTPPAAGRCW